MNTLFDRTFKRNISEAQDGDVFCVTAPRFAEQPKPSDTTPQLEQPYRKLRTRKPLPSEIE